MTATIAIDSLVGTFSGEIILPGDALYQQASSTIMTQGSPAVILRPKTAQDVVQALDFAKNNRLPISVRSGGHSGLGYSTNTDGLVIDVSLINQIEVLNQEQGIIRVGAGATWGQVAVALEPYGLAISSGDTKSVGVGGLVLGGGIGWMVRKLGLALDNLVRIELVTADGQLLEASNTINPDLFWAVRGGGGNFGVVVSCDFRAFQLKQVVAGSITYGLPDLKAVLTGWVETMRTAPEELTTMLLVMPAFGEKPASVLIIGCYAGEDEAAAQTAFAPLLQLGTVIHQDLKPKAYAEVLEEAHPPHGIKVIAKNVFIDHFDHELIEAIVALTEQSTFPVLQIRSLGGAMNRVSADQTAFGYRHSEALLVGATFVPPTSTEVEIDQALQPWLTLVPFGSGVYGNLLTAADEADLKAVYPDATYQRLVEVKRKYDPTNVFNQNFNIKLTNS